MKRIILIIFALCSLLTALCSAQQSITWQKIYDGPAHLWDEGYDICSTFNNNFYVFGYTTVPINSKRMYVIKINKMGDTIWSRIIGNGEGYAITNTIDGGCVITGGMDQAFAIKVDNNGNIVWNKTYGGNFIQCYDIIQTTDGGYIACGRDVNVHSDGYIMKIDSFGDLQWQMVYPSLEFKSFESITEVNGVGYAVTGTVSDYPQDTSKCLLIKFDLSGNIIWEKRFNYQNRFVGGGTINKLVNGYLIGGEMNVFLQSLISDYFIIRTDTAGNLIFTKIFSSSQSEYYGDLRVINENRYIISSERDSIGTSYMLVDAKIIDSLGNILYRKTYSYGRYVEIRKILPLSNGDIIFAGMVEPIQPPYWSDFYIIRSDSILNAPPIGIELLTHEVPEQFQLLQNFPNPFNPSTTIKFSIGQSELVQLKIFDVDGRLIKTLVNSVLKPGVYTTKWEGADFPSGVYLYALYLGNKLFQTKKMVLLK